MQSKPTIPRTCPQCGDTFVAPPSSVKRYCSRACYLATNIGPAHPRWVEKIERSCATCGAAFTVFPCDDERRRHCSKACKGASQRTGGRIGPTMEATCEVCGTTFRCWPYEQRTGLARYCSTACRGVSQRTGQTRLCSVCGRAFFARAEQLTRGQGRYCSPACRNIARRNMANTQRSGYRYRQWREAVLARDSQTCRKCGVTGVQLDAHHIKSWWRHVALRFDVANGLTLCGPCHDTLHGVTPH